MDRPNTKLSIFTFEGMEHTFDYGLPIEDLARLAEKPYL
jgi:hypothetical protein